MIQVDRAVVRHRQLRRQVEELEEGMLRERSKGRQQQRTIDELTETNETLTRENAQLKSVAALARRNTITTRASTSRPGSMSASAKHLHSKNYSDCPSD